MYSLLPFPVRWEFMVGVESTWALGPFSRSGPPWAQPREEAGLNAHGGASRLCENEWRPAQDLCPAWDLHPFVPLFTPSEF